MHTCLMSLAKLLIFTDVLALMCKLSSKTKGEKKDDQSMAWICSFKNFILPFQCQRLINSSVEDIIHTETKMNFHF